MIVPNRMLRNRHRAGKSWRKAAVDSMSGGVVDLLVTQFAVGADRLPAARGVRLVVATEATVGCHVALVVEIGTEGDLHVGKYVAAVCALDGSHGLRQGCLIDGSAARFVEAAEALIDRAIGRFRV